MGVIGLEYFKARIVSKLKQVNSDIIDSHIYSAQSSERYYIDEECRDMMCFKFYLAYVYLDWCNNSDGY